jgi:hypothetical protein
LLRKTRWIWVGRVSAQDGVDLYKVGHHGSLNATPKASLWPLFKKRSKKATATRLRALLSTMKGKHGSARKGTEVPRSKLLAALKAETELLDTEKFRTDELYCDTEISLGAARRTRRSG